MPSKRASKPKHTRAVAQRDVNCADFIARDKTVHNYGYSAAEVERLIEKVLAFLQAGVEFIPDAGQYLRAELDGEALTFRPGAAQRLAGRRSERAYLLSLVVQREFQVWATKFIPLAAQMDVQRAVEALHLSISYSEFRLPPPGAGPDAQATTVPLADITEAVEKHPAFVILGEPGAGKTTTLQKIAFEKAWALLPGDEGRVPLFVRLSQQGGRDPFDFLKTEWERRTGSDFADALAAGRALVLADGLNEIARSDRDERAQRLKAWRLFVRDYGGANQFIFSGRAKDYDAELNLPRVLVEPLDDDRIADYLSRNHAGGLAEWLDNPQTKLRPMARNPFNLSLLVSAFQSGQGTLSNRGRLFAWFAGELFAREDRLAHPRWLPPAAQTRALAQLAYAMQAQGESTTFPLATAWAALPETVDFGGEEWAVKPADLFRFARAATLFDPLIEPEVRFHHHLLQEYFAALELLRRFDAGEDLSALWRAPRLAAEMQPAEVGQWDPLPEPPSTGWEVTTLLAAGLASDPAQLVEAVRAHNPTLAGRCLDESGMEFSETVMDTVRADLRADLENPAIHLRARLQAGFTLGKIRDPRFAPQMLNGMKVILPAMVDVPGGTYLIGSRDNEPGSFDNEKPQHSVELAAFSIGKWPVTNAEFACFMKAEGYKAEGWWKTDLALRWLKGEEVTGGQATNIRAVWQFMHTNEDWRKQFERAGLYSSDQIKAIEFVAELDEESLTKWLAESYSGKSRMQPDFWDDAAYNNPLQPVVGVTWFEARAYCEWLSEISGRAYRLPTEAEWEAAARGRPTPDNNRLYPWGDEWDAPKANTLEGRVLKPSPVGAYAAAGGVGPFGAHDQAGNVWEWTSSLYLPFPYRYDECEKPEAEGERAVRGGSWFNARQLARCAYRLRLVPDNFYKSLGFRVVSPGSISGF